jgi:hypothetical protein
VIALDEFQGVHEIFRDRPALKKADLIQGDEAMNFTLQSCGKEFGNNLHVAILKTDRAEVTDEHRRRFFWQEHYKSTVDPAKLNITRVESVKHLQDLMADRVPSRKVETGTKPIRPWRSVLVHRAHNVFFASVSKKGASSDELSRGQPL